MIFLPGYAIIIVKEGGIRMKKLLICGFMPFGGEEINPSWEAVKRLPGKIGGYALTKLCIPVVFGEAPRAVLTAAREISPEAILCIGQAGGRSAITPELVGINLRYAKIPDNKGNEPKDEPIIPGGKSAYFSTLPVRKMSEAIKSAGIPSELSYSAGAYVCNDLLYSLLAEFENTETRVAFIHVPYIPEQEKEPNLPLDDIVKALAIAIESMDDQI